jgi:hypothetical protein
MRLAWCVANISSLKRSRSRRASSRFPLRATKRSSRRHIVGTLIIIVVGRVETAATLLLDAVSPEASSIMQLWLPIWTYGKQTPNVVQRIVL